jgi:hypothetical protein
MKHLATSFASPAVWAAVIATSTVCAQGYVGEGPGAVAVPQVDPSLGPIALGVDAVAQILLVPHEFLGPGRRYVAATVRHVGRSDWDVMTGVYDTSGPTPVFVRNTDVDHLNSSGDEFACSISPDLLHVALDTPLSHPIGSGRVVIASRATPAGGFGPGQPVNNLQPGYVDPQFLLVGGILNLAYIRGSDLYRARIDPATAQLDTQREVSLYRAPAGRNAHSPSPMQDAGGNATAMVFSLSPASAMFQPRLEANGSLPVRAYEMLNRGTWLANPDADGGTIRYAEASSTYVDPVRLEVVALSSSAAYTPGVLTFTVFAPVRRSTDPQFIATIGLGDLAPGPIRVPGIGGSPLSLLPLYHIDPLFHFVDRETGATTVPLPINAAVFGSIYAQAFVYDPRDNQVRLSNTATCEVQPAPPMMCRYRLNHVIMSRDCAACPAAVAAMPAVMSTVPCVAAADCASSIHFTFPCAGGGNCQVEYLLTGCN